MTESGVDITTGCLPCKGACVAACFNEAIAWINGKGQIDEDLCAGCGACISSCEYGLIGMDKGVARVRA